MNAELLYYHPASLRLARDSRGASQDDVARALAVTPSKVSKWEAGLLPMRASDVEEIGEFLGYPPAFFASENVICAAPSSRVYHRAQASLGIKFAKQIDATAAIAGDRVGRLLRPIDDFPVKFKRIDVDSQGSPADVARTVRAAWGIPYGPVDNVVGRIEAAGGIVLFIDFGSTKIDAVSLWPAAAPPVFIVNRGMPTDRMRFTLAHEIGHIFMHEWSSEDPEREADEFASEFLLPAAELRPELAHLDLKRAAALKQYWGASMRAIIRTAHTLRCITPSRYKSLNVLMSQAGFTKIEPVSLPVESPKTIGRILRIYRDDLDYSLEQVAHAVVARADRLEREFWPVHSEGIWNDTLA